MDHDGFDRSAADVIESALSRALAYNTARCVGVNSGQTGRMTANDVRRSADALIHSITYLLMLQTTPSSRPLSLLIRGSCSYDSSPRCAASDGKQSTTIRHPSPLCPSHLNVAPPDGWNLRPRPVRRRLLVFTEYQQDASWISITVICQSWRSFAPIHCFTAAHFQTSCTVFRNA